MKINKKTTKKTLKKTLKKTNNIKLKKTTKRTRKIKGGAPDGTKFIGEGSFGCVYSPGLKCDKEQVQDPKIKTISKLMISQDSYIEWAINIILELLQYDTEYKFHLPLPIRCKTSQYKTTDFIDCKIKGIHKTPEYYGQETDPYFLTYEDGGIDFFMLHKKEYFHPQNVFSENGLPKILDGIIALQEKGLIHGDIRLENIVTGFFDDPNNPGSINFKLIDFGLIAFTGEKDISNISSNQTLVEKNILSQSDFRHITTEILRIISTLGGPKLGGGSIHNPYPFKVIRLPMPVYCILFYINDLFDRLEYRLLAKLNDDELTKLIEEINVSIATFRVKVTNHTDLYFRYILKNFTYVAKFFLDHYGGPKGIQNDINNLCKELIELRLGVNVTDILNSRYQFKKDDFIKNFVQLDKSKREERDIELKKYLCILAKKIDYCSFAIVLLNYVHLLDDKFGHDNEIVTKIIEPIFIFIEKNNLLNHNVFKLQYDVIKQNFTELQPDEIKQNFTTLCKEIISKFEQPKN